LQQHLVDTNNRFVRVLSILFGDRQRAKFDALTFNASRAFD
jgi:hypothetical protein